MCAHSLSTVDFEILEKAVSTAIDNARSLNEIEAWLKMQQCVKSVQLADYFLKSNPPQRDFIVAFTLHDGSALTKIVNFFDLGNGKYRFHVMRDQ